MGEFKFLNIEKADFTNPRREDPVISKRIEAIMGNLTANGDAHFFFAQYFKDPDLFNALPEAIRNSDEELGSFIENTEKFGSLISTERSKRFAGEQGLFGEMVHIPVSEHHDGRQRRAEEGYRVNVEFLKTQGIDASKVLFFRITQPSGNPKPEYYWTSDYREARDGLTREISQSQRDTAVVLIADLETINTNGGLMQDVNDDSGLAVRQIGLSTFDQRKTLASIKIKK